MRSAEPCALGAVGVLVATGHRTSLDGSDTTPDRERAPAEWSRPAVHAEGKYKRDRRAG